ncbi:MAG TPA: O-antigen ligase family protein [Actinomycetes bacterium]|nr:O-antigen ligase family protein [Actinomycetes bacterium]
MPERSGEVSSTGVAAQPGPRRSGLPEGWPVLLLFGAFPVWWALGLSSIICILFAVPMLAWLLARGRVRVPKGFGLWLAFLFWMLLSATQLDETRRWYAFSYRGALYLSMTVMFLYVYNLPRSAMPTRRIVLALALFWATVICFGFAALAAPDFKLTTPVLLLLPEQLASSAYAQDVFSPKLAQVQTFIGYALTRPAAPFTYTNEWGGSVGLLTPMALAALGLVRSYLTRNLIRLLVVASLVPIVISANRGLWVGLGVGLVYAALRVALRGNARALLAIVGFLALVAALVVLTPLERYVDDRLTHQHSNERRESLSGQAVRGAFERPLLGYGGPRESTETPNAPDIGTHGQVYLVIFSHGVPGLAFFLGWWLWVLWVSHRGATGPPLWCHVMLLIGVLEFLYYDMMPTQLHLMMVVAAVAWREREAQASNPDRRSGTRPDLLRSSA